MRDALVLGLVGAGIYTGYRLVRKGEVREGELAVLGIALLLAGCIDTKEPVIDYRPASTTWNGWYDPSVRNAFCRFLERCGLQKADPTCWSQPAANQCEDDKAFECVQALDGMPCKEGGLPVDCIPCLKRG